MKRTAKQLQHVVNGMNRIRKSCEIAWYNLKKRSPYRTDQTFYSRRFIDEPF